MVKPIKNNNEQISIVIAIIGFFIGLLLTSIFFQLNPTIKNSVQLKEDDRAMLFYRFVSWGENIDNSKEVVFSGWIYNFGDSEGKNITLTCPIDIDGEEIERFNYYAGNVASNSIEYIEFSKIYTAPKGVTGICYLDSCDDCVNLFEKIPELKNE